MDYSVQQQVTHLKFFVNLDKSGDIEANVILCAGLQLSGSLLQALDILNVPSWLCLEDIAALCLLTGKSKCVEPCTRACQEL